MWMSDPTVQRTLVKSPPELWAEISDAEALARHLGAFGEIRITRLEPETTVVWEGDAACGTVSLAPSGWGTKVTLTAELQALEEALVEEPVEPVAAVVEPEPEPVAVEPEPEPEPVAVEPKPEPVIPKRGFFARLFGRATPVEPVAVVVEAPPGSEEEVQPTEPFDVVVEEEPAPEVEIEVEVEPVAAFGPEDAQEALADALDSLGSAHHRPFSRG